LPVTYAGAGVRIAEADKLVRRIKRAVRATYTPSVLGDVGAFGAFYDARFRKYRSPVLVSSVDGVGTKLIIARLMKRHDTVGQDLVNHCVNDIAVCGAVPLYFMDYFAAGRLSAAIAGKVIGGFVRACRENGCSLIGGETAEMPGMYDAGEYDLAGTIVGVVEKRKIINGRRVRAGDVLLGLASTGLHTNGYSLARRVLLRKYRLHDRVPGLGATLGNALLTVHRSYLAVIRSLLDRFDVHGLAHITGGGIVGNTMRVVPDGLGLRIAWDAWERPPVFDLIQRSGPVPERDMRKTFNLGIGLVAILPRRQAGDALRYLHRRGETAFLIGNVIPPT
jgi:phosphoribosylformylglycinamidine cyclo-ligase